MASGKNFRQEKRVPTFYVMVTAVVFVGLCLIGAWVLSSPSESQFSESNEIDVEVEGKTEIKVRNNEINESFEESAGDPTLESEEKQEETPKNEPEEKQEETPKNEPEETKPFKGSKEEEVSEESEPEPEPESEPDSFREKQNPAKISREEEVSEDLEPEAESKPLSQKDEDEVIIKEKETSESPKYDDDIDVTQKKRNSKESSDYGSEDNSVNDADEDSKTSSKQKIEWTLCDTNAGVDYIPCLDNTKAIKALHSTKHYEHRERHCPDPAPECLVPLPEGYRTPITWPLSRNEVWYKNVPHTGLVSYKKDQQWVKQSNDRLIFPGGGTQFKQGALHYIDYVQEKFPKIRWGKRTRVLLDVGCGVASFGGYMFDRDVLTMSFAPKDEHEAQVQFALERGIPAISSVMGTQRLVFPSNVYDAVHCARCRVPWHIEGGKLLLELNRVLRPGGYFVWSATPVYWDDEEDVQIWKDTRAMTIGMCWRLVAKFVDPSTGIGAAIFQKPTTNDCYEKREKDFPPMCEEDDKPDDAWYTPMTACLHKIPAESNARGTEWPQKWPQRLLEAPAWLATSQNGVSDFQSDTERWERIVKKSYLQGFGIEWQNIRNVMDMRAVYGGFAAALVSQPVWVMNVVPFDAPKTLPLIFDRGLFGIYHDWCESFSSYPRTYDLLHADHLFSRVKKRCNVKVVIAEMDRLLRPNGWLIVRESVDTMSEVQALIESLHWDVRMTFSKSTEALIAVQKTDWRPESTIF